MASPQQPRVLIAFEQRARRRSYSGGVDQLTYAYGRVAAWLGRSAPVTAATLRPAASDGYVQSVLSRVRRHAPGEVVSFWRCHDGVDSENPSAFVLPGGYRPLRLDEVVKLSGSLEGRWIPVAARSADALLLVDCEPGPTSGHLVVQDQRDMPVVEDLTLTDLLGRVAGALRASTAWRGWAVGVVEGELRWIDSRPGATLSTRDAEAITTAQAEQRAQHVEVSRVGDRVARSGGSPRIRNGSARRQAPTDT